MDEQDKRVVKTSSEARTVHWMHTITWFVMLFSGLVLFSGWFNWLAPVFGGAVGANLIHKLFAIVFISVPLIGLFMRPRNYISWMKTAFHWGRDEIIFMMRFPLDFLGFEVEMPPQDQINAGQKLNSLLFPTIGFFIALSGVIMWFATYFPIWLVQVAYIVHDACWIIGTAQVCLHAYLGSLHPDSGESFWAMFGNGTVKASWAKHHHAKWYDKTYGKD
jgi:formate dehydrogenase subunit gamma